MEDSKCCNSKCRWCKGILIALVAFALGWLMCCALACKTSGCGQSGETCSYSKGKSCQKKCSSYKKKCSKSAEFKKCSKDCVKACCAKADAKKCSQDCAKACCLGCKATVGDAKCKPDHSCCVKEDESVGEEQ